MCGGAFTEHFGYAAVFSTAAVTTLLALVPARVALRR
jgi:predicted MFS family arabinose efflux permease